MLISQNYHIILYFFLGCIPNRNFEPEYTFEKNLARSLKKTDKVLLVISAKFLESVYDSLQRSNILSHLANLHFEGKLDVMTIFVEDVTLDEDKHIDLLKLDNVDAFDHPFDWNIIRRFLSLDRRTIARDKRKPGKGHILFSHAADPKCNSLC